MHNYYVYFHFSSKQLISNMCYTLAWTNKKIFMAGEYSHLLLPPAVGKVLRDMETMAKFLTLPMFMFLSSPAARSDVIELCWLCPQAAELWSVNCFTLRLKKTLSNMQAGRVHPQHRSTSVFSFASQEDVVVGLRCMTPTPLQLLLQSFGLLKLCQACIFALRFCNWGKKQMKNKRNKRTIWWW